MEEFFDLTKAFAFLDVPKGNNLAIITLSGGEGVLATDICETSSLRMAQVSDNTYQRLKRIFPPWEIPLNPIDVGVCLEFHLSDIVKVFDGLKAIPEDEHVDCVVMQLPPDLFGRDSENEDLSAETFDLLKEEYTQALVNIKRIEKKKPIEGFGGSFHLGPHIRGLLGAGDLCGAQKMVNIRL